MKLASEERIADQGANAFYLPHHGVLKFIGEKPKLRVVFSGSVRLALGHNINDCLLPGQKLQTEIVDVLLRWRVFKLFKFVFSADIEKMFRQFLIAEDDRKYQRILWRREISDPIQTYELQTVTYGLVSSLYQAIRTVLQLAADEETRFPAASQLLRHNIYVDDILGGHNDLDNARQIQKQLIELLKAGGLRLSKWMANHASLLACVSPEDLASTRSRTWQSEEHQMLGISWRPAQDAFFFHAKVHQNSEFISKALSLIAQLYEPLGWITPVVIRFKIFMQSLWHSGLQWDDLLPKHLHDRWTQLISSLKDLDLISIPRWIGLSNNLKHAEVHGFADASERAYAAVLYLRTIDQEDQVRPRLLLAKTKVSPLKQVSLPRLELCGAVLLVRLVRRVQVTLSQETISCHLWLDSTVALSWIQGHPTKWKTYVANGVSEIQRSLPQASWHHVKSTENPADIASRGASPRELSESSLWLSGPQFLLNSTQPWPTTGNYNLLSSCPDQRSVVCVLAKSLPTEWELVRRYSSLTKLLRVTARSQLFIQHCRKKSRIQENRRATHEAATLTPHQLIPARNFWIQHAQSIYLAGECQVLLENKPLPRQSTLLRLHPILEHGLI